MSTDDVNTSSRISTESSIQSDVPFKYVPRKKKQSFEDFEEMQDELLERMKVFNENNLLRHYDERHLWVLDKLRNNVPKTTIDEKIEDKKGNIEKQLDENNKRLSELLEMGSTLISNIRIEIEQRENKRKGNEEEKQDLIKSNTAAAYVQSLAEFDNIVAKWSELDEIKEPLLLSGKLEEQKARIERLMEHKTDIITQCQQEFERMNREYYEEEQRQVKIMCSLMERINAQMEMLHENNAHSLRVMEDVLNAERDQLNTETTERLYDFMNEVVENDKQKQQIKKGNYEFFANRLQRLVRDQEELTYSLRKRLNNDIETLQLDINNQRQEILTASEKLEYNTQVLVLKNAEELTFNNQQKRRVGKQIERIRVMKKNLEIHKKQRDLDIHKFHVDIEKVSESVTSLEKIGQSLRSRNKKKFDAMWHMNFQEITVLCKKLFEIDKLLTEQQLVVEWQQPDIDFTDINAPPEVVSVQSIHTDVPTCLSKHLKQPTKQTRSDTLQPDRLQMRLIRCILRQIADRTGFLIEEKLLKILEPYTEEDKQLVRLDNVFNALRITQFQSLEKMSDYFRKYAWCPNCEHGLTRELVEELVTAPMGAGNLRPSTRNSNAKGKEFKNCSDHYLIVEKAFVLTILNAFVDDMLVDKKRTKSLSSSSAFEYKKSLIEFKDENIYDFFSKFLHCIPPEKSKLWKVLEHGLNHYIVILREREQLVRECQDLKQQNRELKYLLTNFTCG